LLSKQLLEQEKIIDFTAGNEYWRDLMQGEWRDWTEIEFKYKPLYGDLMHQIKHSFTPEDINVRLIIQNVFMHIVIDYYILS